MDNNSVPCFGRGVGGLGFTRGRGLINRGRGFGRGLKHLYSSSPVSSGDERSVKSGDEKRLDMIRNASRGRGFLSNIELSPNSSETGGPAVFTRGRGLKPKLTGAAASSPSSAPRYLDDDYIDLENPENDFLNDEVKDAAEASPDNAAVETSVKDADNGTAETSSVIEVPVTSVTLSESDIIPVQFDNFYDSDEEDLVQISQQFRVGPANPKSALENMATFSNSENMSVETSPIFEQQDPKVVKVIRMGELREWREDLRKKTAPSLGPVKQRQRIEERAWQQWERNTHGFYDWLYNFLLESGRPYQTALVILNTILKGKSGKRDADSTFCQVIYKCLKRVVPPSRHDLTPDLRRYAFFLGQREGIATTREIVSVFHLSDDSKENVFGALIDDLLDRGIYREAVQFIGLLKLHRRYTVEKTHLPVIAEDRMNVVEECINENEEAQKELLSFLDKFYDQLDKIIEFLSECRIDTLQIQQQNLTSSALQKLALRLHKKYKLPQSVLPRLAGGKCRRDIARLVFERYVTKLRREDWEEAILHAVGDIHESAVQLVRLLIDYRQGKAAKKWAQRFHVTADDVPELEMVNDDADSDEAEDTGWTVRDAAPMDNNFLQFPLHPNNDIEFICDEDGLWSAISHAEAADKIGFDMEWTTPYGSNETCVSILQMALNSWVFIFDMISLTRCMETDDTWLHFKEKVMENPRITKLFYSAYQDLLMLGRCCPALSGMESFANVVDLEQLYAEISLKSPQFFAECAPQGGLSGLVATCLGKPLDKTQRCSNWQRRPLSRPQMVYAALDAHCLLSVHDWMEDRKTELNLVSLDLRSPANLKPPEKKKKKKRKDVIKPPCPSSASSSSPGSRGGSSCPASLFLAIDPQIRSVGEILRSCGCNVTMGLDGDDLEDRVVVTTEGNLPQLEVANHIQKVAVGEHFTAEEQAMSILASLNASMQPRDLNDPCTNCSCRDFMELSPDVVAILNCDLNASISAREQKRLRHRGVDIETATVTCPLSNTEHAIHFSADDGEGLVFLCRACGLATREKEENRQFRMRLETAIENLYLN